MDLYLALPFISWGKLKSVYGELTFTSSRGSDHNSNPQPHHFTAWTLTTAPYGLVKVYANYGSQVAIEVSSNNHDSGICYHKQCCWYNSLHYCQYWSYLLRRAKRPGWLSDKISLLTSEINTQTFYCSRLMSFNKIIFLPCFTGEV